MATITIDIPQYDKNILEQKKRQMNKVVIDVPVYAHSGVFPILEENYVLYVEIDSTNTVLIKANKGGLISLARHLLTLAQDEYPIGSHIHYDETSILEDGSHSLIVDKIREQGTEERDKGDIS
jgi:hypothetical protein